MKLKLPLVLLLLAVVGVTWIALDFARQSAIEQTVPPLAHTIPTDGPYFAPLPNLFDSIPSTEPAEAIFDPAVEPVALIQAAAIDTTPFRFASFAPAADAPANLLVQAAKAIENAGPISSRARVKIDMFGQEVIGYGFFYHAGQGRGLSRIDLEFPVTEDNIFRMTKICDGKFHYSIEEFQGQRKIEFVDLDEFEQSVAGKLADNPTQWFARAGISSLLMNLGTAFHFGEPQKADIGGLTMLQLRGQWKADSLKNVMLGRRNLQTKEGEMAWERVPAQVPHAVEVFLGGDEFLPLFPYRIVFHKIETQSKRAQPIATFELFEVQKDVEFPADLFRVNADNSQQVDMSGKYSDHIQQIVDSAASAAADAKAK